jgi:hypothetical protein
MEFDLQHHQVMASASPVTKSSSLMPSMLLPGLAIAVIAHANEGFQGQVHRSTATTLRLPYSAACCLKKLQILLWLTPKYETIAGSLVQ